MCLRVCEGDSELSTYVCNFLLSGGWTADRGGQKGKGISDPSLQQFISFTDNY